MWPVSQQKVVKKMSKYIKEATPEQPELPALPPPETPRTTTGFRAKWQGIQSKLGAQLSSPSQQKFNSLDCGLQSLLDVSDIT